MRAISKLMAVFCALKSAGNLPTLLPIAMTRQP